MRGERRRNVFAIVMGLHCLDVVLYLYLFSDQTKWGRRCEMERYYCNSWHRRSQGLQLQCQSDKKTLHQHGLWRWTDEHSNDAGVFEWRWGDIGATGQEENIGAIWRWRSASRNAGSDMKCSHSSHSAVNPVINLKYQPLRSMLKACHSLIRTNQIFRLVPDFQYWYLELQTNHHNHGEGPLW